MSQEFYSSEDYYKIVAVTVRPFLFEYEGNFQEAVTAHEFASRTLKILMEAAKKNVGKFHRKMFERQIGVHDERKKYLDSFKGDFKEVVVPPTIRSADAEFILGEGQARPLSLVSSPALIDRVELTVGRTIKSSPSARK